MSADPGCEGRTTESLLGYTADTQSSAAPRPLTRCYNESGWHLHAVDAPCPSGTRTESRLGYVR